MDFQIIVEGIQISCDSPAVECDHTLTPGSYSDFIAALGIPNQQDPIAAVKAAAEQGKDELIYDAVHKFAATNFSWMSFGD